jgi:hypothetical protein
MGVVAIGRAFRVDLAISETGFYHSGQLNRLGQAMSTVE